MRQVYIYALCEPDQPWNIRYVGKTIDSLEHRLSEHMEPNKLKISTHKNSWIKSLIRVNKTPFIKLLDIGSDQDWEDLEKFYISSYQSAGFDLTNSTAGGQAGYVDAETLLKISKSLKGHKVSQETRDKISAAQRGKPGHALGCVRSAETREKISKTLKGRKVERIISEEEHVRRSESRKGIKPRLGHVTSEEHRRKISLGLKEYWRKKKEGAEIFIE